MIGRRIALIFYSKILRQVIGLFAVMLTSWLLGPEVIGVTAYAASFIAIAWFIADFGLETTHQKMVHDSGNPAACIGALALFKIGFSLIASLFVIAGVWMYHAGGKFTDPRQAQVILLWLAGNFIASLTSIATHTFTARQEVAKAEAVEMTEMMCDLAGSIIVCLSFRNHLEHAAMAMAASYITSNLIAGAVAWRLFRGCAVVRPDRALLRRYVQFAAPMAFILAAAVINLNIDKLFIGAFYTPEDVGLYHGATRINRILLFLSGAAMTVLAPAFFQYMARRDMAGIRDILHKAQRYLSLIVTGMAVVMILCGQGIVAVILGPRFSGSVMPLHIMNLVALLTTLGRPIMSILIAQDKPRLYVWQFVLGVILNIALNLLLVPRSLGGIPLAGLGITGAAIATLTAQIVMLTIAAWTVWSVTGIGPYAGLVKHAAAGAMTVAGVSTAQAVIGYGGNLWVAAPVNALAGLTLFSVLLALFGELSRADARHIWENIRARAVLSYASQELKSGATPPNRNV